MYLRLIKRRQIGKPRSARAALYVDLGNGSAGDKGGQYWEILINYNLPVTYPH